MTDIGTYTSNFFNEIVNYGINIPVKFKIYALIILILILLEIYFIVIKKIPIKSKYVTWGFVFIILNIINIIFMMALYIKLNGSFVGEPGEKGLPGDKGDIGTNLTCKICDFNIYLQKTNRYDLKMRFATNVFQLIFNQSFDYINIKNLINEDTNIDRLLNDIYRNDLNDNLSQLYGLIKLHKYVLMYDLMEATLPVYNKMIIKVPGGKTGFLPLSDILTSEDYQAESFVFNGDVRYPTSYSKITSIFSKENDKPVKYDIMKINAPDGYKGLGVVLFKSGQAKDLKQYLTLNKNCIKKAKVQDYKIKYIYPDNRNGFISLWMSDFNTLQVVHAKENDIKNNYRIIEIIKSYDEDIYYSSGSIKKEIIKQANDFYSKIKISKLSIFSYIVANYFNIIKNDFKDFKKLFVIPLKLKLGIYSNDDINLNNVSKILSKISSEVKKAEEQYNKKLLKLPDIQVENIINNDQDTKSLLFNANKMINLMQKTLDFIPVYVENTNTLLELVDVIFPDGLLTKVKRSKLTDSQKSLIYLLKVLMPPLEDIYIPKNSCLTYENIDEDRLELLNNCETVINKYNDIIENVNNDIEQQYTNNIRNEMNRLNDLILYNFDKNLSNINDYLAKIGNYNFKEFTNNQVNLILSEYLKVIKLIEPNYLP